MTPYEKVLSHIKSEGVIVEEKFISSVQHPCEQYQLGIFERDGIIDAIITIPKFSDEPDVIKAVRLAYCYSEFEIARQNKGFKREVLFLDSRITNYIKGKFAWDVCESLLLQLEIIEKPQKKEKFWLTYLYTGPGEEFMRVKESTREYFKKKHSLGRSISNCMRSVVNWILNLIRLYIGIGLLVVFHKENYPIPYVSSLMDWSGMGSKGIYNLWYTIATIYTLITVLQSIYFFVRAKKVEGGCIYVIK
ncbi:hypothetical protein ACDX77_19155 [Bacillus velezensis]|uniref:hypothetical protein n=1 Tax=Bacillus velezensis TaxID=492670 RepID=UPI003556C24D